MDVIGWKLDLQAMPRSALSALKYGPRTKRSRASRTGRPGHSRKDLWPLRITLQAPSAPSGCPGDAWRWHRAAALISHAAAKALPSRPDLEDKAAFPRVGARREAAYPQVLSARLLSPQGGHAFPCGLC